MEARQLKLQESQCQLGDALNMLVNSDTSTLGGGVSPMIDTKSVTTATTAGVDLALLMAQTNANQQQLITAINNMNTNTPLLEDN